MIIQLLCRAILGGNTVHRHYAIEDTQEEAWQSALDWMARANAHVFATFPPSAIKHLTFDIREVEEQEDRILDIFRNMEF